MLYLVRHRQRLLRKRLTKVGWMNRMHGLSLCQAFLRDNDDVSNKNASRFLVERGRHMSMLKPVRKLSVNVTV